MKLVDSHSKAGANETQQGAFRLTRSRLGSPGVTSSAPSPFDSPIVRTAKRALDLSVVIGLGAVLSPLLVLIAVAVKSVSPGPVLYGQVRLGRAGKPFRLWKFRTMIPGAEDRLQELLMDNPCLNQEWTNGFKLEQDPRVIPLIGKVLRKYRLDELPQLWNVLAGDMSVVGPRPLPQYHLDQFDLEFQRLRSAMPPGITGPWQIHSREHGGADSFRKWDTEYVDRWSLWRDLQILCRTPWAVLSGNGTE